MEDKDYKKESNPTYFTAKGTLFKLAEAKNQDAIEFMKIVDTSDLVKGIKESGNFIDKYPKEVGQRMSKGLGYAVELRYDVVSKVLDESKLKNFFDVACGYTPRALYCKKKGIDYVGADVPIVVKEMNEKVGELVGNGKHIPYIAADATNPVTLVKASDCLEGEVFISCEGLIMYLSLDELQEFISGVKAVLAKHGGAWYTSDLGVDYVRVPFPFINDEKITKGMEQDASTLKDTSDIKYFSNNFKTDEDKIQFFESKGLKVEKIAIKDLNLSINQLEDESEEIKANVKKLFDTFYCCRITLKEEERAKLSVGLNDSSNVKIGHSLSGGKFLLTLEGRIDTLTAPELLKAYDIESKSGDINSIEIDAKELEYISSAGLRVILKMGKKLKGGSIDLIGANETVKEILKTTGFDSFVNIK